MYYVYFLVSKKNGDVYIGSTENIEKRVLLHNSGKVRSTKAYRPWQLVGFKEYQTRSEAVRKEKFYKSHQQKDRLKEKYYGRVAKW